jgi:hypothetical protein
MAFLGMGIGNWEWGIGNRELGIGKKVWVYLTSTRTAINCYSKAKGGKVKAAPLAR